MDKARRACRLVLGNHHDAIARYVAATPLLVPGAFLLTVDLVVYAVSIIAVIVPLEPEAGPHPLVRPRVFFSLVKSLRRGAQLLKQVGLSPSR